MPPTGHRLPVAAILPVLAALVSGAGTDRSAWVERPRWHVAEQGLQLRYHGGPPRWTQGTLTGPHRVYVDLDARCRVVGVLTESVLRHPALAGWAMAPREGSHTRITMLFRAPTAVSVRVDPAERVLWLVPQAPGVAASSPPPVGPPVSTAAPPRVAQMRLRPSGFGPAPQLPSPRVDVAPSPLPTASPAPDLQAILAGLEALDRPSPQPSEPGAGVLPVPGAAAEPTPVPLPAPPTAPFPSPVVLAPPLAPATPPFDMHLATAGMVGPYEVAFPADNMTARTDSAHVVGGRLNGRWALGPPAPAGTDGWLPWWSLQLDAWASSLAYLDPRIANGLHARQAWRLQAAALRGVRLSPLELQGGLGLMARHQLDWQAVVPVGGAPLSATSRTLLAPELALFARVPVVGGLELYGEGALAPVAFALDGSSATEPVPTNGSRWEAGVGWTHGGLRVAAGYRRWMLGGMGYTEVLSGPVLTVGGWLAPGNPREAVVEDASAVAAPRED
ncbi:MAG: hypothetical protein VKS61_09730 [Candidatus Sericytochromatia bacterium]|nr:hypothetical protein [Candidatus Sericytochromatia bacterium]